MARGLHGLVGLSLLLASACGSDPPKPPPTPPPPSIAARAEDLLPPELDLVVRLDVARLRSALGDPAWGALSSRVPDGSTGRASLSRVLRERSKTLWIGLRGLPIEHVDGVLLARGDFGMLELDQSGSPFEGFRAVPSGAPGVLSFERVSKGPRSAPSWLLMIRSDTLLIATPALEDASRRALERGPGPRRLDPPADGLIGAEARPRLLGPELSGRFPSLAGLLSEIDTVSAVGDIDGGVLRLDAAVKARSPSGAERADRVLSALRKELSEGEAGPLREAARATQVEREGEVVRLKMRAPGEQAKRVLGLSPP